jgi:dihydrofolate reductase
MKLTLATFLSIDGVMQSPSDPTEDPRNGFALGGWLVPFVDKTWPQWFPRADAFLLGRRSFELMAAYWPNVTDPDDITAASLNTKPKYVVSNTLTSAAWTPTSFITGDLRTAVEKLKTEPGDELQVHGSGRLARSLHDLGLIDEYRLWTFPVVLGKGLRLFSDGATPTGMALVDHQVTGTGVSIHTFRPTGPIIQGNHKVEAGIDVAH